MRRGFLQGRLHLRANRLAGQAVFRQSIGVEHIRAGVGQSGLGNMRTTLRRHEVEGNEGSDDEHNDGGELFHVVFLSNGLTLVVVK